MWRLAVTVLLVSTIAGICVAKPQNVQWPGGNVLALPYYGGARGQVLQIMQDPATGAVVNQVIVPESSRSSDNKDTNAFAADLQNIQASAQMLVELQEKTKKSGFLKKEDQKLYATNLALLGESASKLAQYGASGDKDFSQLFLNRDGVVKGSMKNGIRQNEDEEDVGEQLTEGTETPPDDSVQIGSQSDSASVAEAKPVGVAVAGEGGVASSKPVATAVVGPGGLAIARPVATAIAGVDPNAVGVGNKIPISAKTQSQRSQTVQAQPIVYHMKYPEYQQLHGTYPLYFSI